MRFIQLLFIFTVAVIVAFIVLDVPDYQSAPKYLKAGTIIIVLGMCYLVVVTWIIPIINKLKKK